MVPTRLEGGVTNAFGACQEVVFGGVDEGGAIEAKDFNAFGRGIDDGEKLRAENDMSDSNESIDEEEEILSLYWDFEKVNGTSDSSSSLKGANTGVDFPTQVLGKGALLSDGGGLKVNLIPPSNSSPSKSSSTF